MKDLLQQAIQLRAGGHLSNRADKRVEGPRPLFADLYGLRQFALGYDQVTLLTSQSPGRPDPESGQRSDQQQPDPSDRPNQPVDRRIHLIPVQPHQKRPVEPGKLVIALRPGIPGYHRNLPALMQLFNKSGLVPVPGCLHGGRQGILQRIEDGSLRLVLFAENDASAIKQQPVVRLFSVSQRPLLLKNGAQVLKRNPGGHRSLEFTLRPEYGG